jgi:hypothetical protein
MECGRNGVWRNGVWEEGESGTVEEWNVVDERLDSLRWKAQRERFPSFHHSIIPLFHY